MKIHPGKLLPKIPVDSTCAGVITNGNSFYMESPLKRPSCWSMLVRELYSCDNLSFTTSNKAVIEKDKTLTLYVVTLIFLPYFKTSLLILHLFTLALQYDFALVLIGQNSTLATS